MRFAGKIWLFLYHQKYEFNSVKMSPRCLKDADSVMT